MGGNVRISLGEEKPVDFSDKIDLGTERSIKLRELQRHYDSLGAYLHVPTKAQLRNPQKLEPSYLKKKCEVVLSIVAEVLESDLFTINLAQRSNLECVRCERQIALRLPLNGDNAVRACKHCGVTYSVSLTHCVPIIDTVTCNLNGCNGKTKVYRADLDEGFQFNCEKCGKLYRFELGFVHRTQKTAD